VSYGLGIERQARKWLSGKITTLVPVPVTDSEGERIPAVQASYANYVWGIPGERESLYPSLGISTTSGEGGRRKIIQVQKDSPADKAGLKVGDVILTMDGQPLADLETFNVIMSRQRWADRMATTVSRDGKEETLTVVFRRDTPEPAKAPQSSTRP